MIQVAIGCISYYQWDWLDNCSFCPHVCSSCCSAYFISVFISQQRLQCVF